MLNLVRNVVPQFFGGDVRLPEMSRSRHLNHEFEDKRKYRTG
jgi:hypothetical protein